MIHSADDFGLAGTSLDTSSNGFPSATSLEPKNEKWGDDRVLFLSSSIADPDEE